MYPALERHPKKMLLRSYYVPSYIPVHSYLDIMYLQVLRKPVFSSLAYSYILTYETRTMYTFFKSHTQCYFYTSCLFCGFCRHEVYYFKMTTLNTAVPDRVIYFFCTDTGISLYIYIYIAIVTVLKKKVITQKSHSWDSLL